ncbi:MAG: hypothetical protein GXZ08_06260 [Tissierellia bacterium]|nr:hypothetical protein [Tissierellia bacterium]
MDNKKQKFKMINLMFNVPFIMLSSIALIVQKEKLSMVLLSAWIVLGLMIRFYYFDSMKDWPGFLVDFKDSEYFKIEAKENLSKIFILAIIINTALMGFILLYINILYSENVNDFLKYIMFVMSLGIYLVTSVKDIKRYY